MNRVLIHFLIIAVLSGNSSASVLSDAVASMEAGSWKKLETLGMTSEFLQSKIGGGGNSITQYANSAVWDPNTKQVLYLGAPHGEPLKFIIYSEETNAWREGPLHPCPVDSCAAHTYDHNTINPDTGKMYFRSQVGPIRRKIFEFDIKKEKWAEPFELLPIDLVNRPRNSGLEYFKELDALINVFPKGDVVLYNIKTNMWEKIASKLDMGTQHVFCEYNPVQKNILFGGGNSKSNSREGNKDIYLFDESKKITKLKPAKIGLRVPGRTGTNIVADPVSGKFLVLTDKHEFYEFDSVLDNWVLLNEYAPIGARKTIVVPISSYGVVMFISFKGKNQDTGVYLYKHINN